MVTTMDTVLFTIDDATRPRRKGIYRSVCKLTVC